jgi:hypothetical protein
MSPRHFSNAQNDGRYDTTHYRYETSEGLLEQRIESFFKRLWKLVVQDK